MKKIGTAGKYGMSSTYLFALVGFGCEPLSSSSVLALLQLSKIFCLNNFLGFIIKFRIVLSKLSLKFIELWLISNWSHPLSVFCKQLDPTDLPPSARLACICSSFVSAIDRETYLSECLT